MSPISSEYDVWTPGAAGYISPTVEFDPYSYESIRAAEQASIPATGMSSYPVADYEEYIDRASPYVVPQTNGGGEIPTGVGIGGGAGVVGLLPAAAGAAGVSLPAWLAGALGLVGAGVGIYQALGGGEGEGLFGNNLLGGDGDTLGGVTLGGPGLAEPPAAQVIRQWNVDYGIPGLGNNFRLQYYDVARPGKRPVRMMYNTKTKAWKWWIIKKPYLAVIGKNLPSHKQLTRLKRNLARHSADARTILKITSPTSLKGYYKSTKRRK